MDPHGLLCSREEENPHIPSVKRDVCDKPDRTLQEDLALRENTELHLSLRHVLQALLARILLESMHQTR